MERLKNIIYAVSCTNVHFSCLSCGHCDIRGTCVSTNYKRPILYVYVVDR
jgi:hypothetical protein